MGPGKESAPTRNAFIVLLIVMALIVPLLLPCAVYAIPTVSFTHPHDDGHVLWWLDPNNKNEEKTSHNHRDGHPFTTAYAWAFACWDCTEYRIDYDQQAFHRGHGFIDEGSPKYIPTYAFDNTTYSDNTSSVWPGEAQGKVQDAFKAWSTLKPWSAWGEKQGNNPARQGLWTGLEFREVAITDSPLIKLHWEDLGLAAGALWGIAKGATDNVENWFSNHQTLDVSFNSELDWYYEGTDTVGAGQYHFYTIALHETGHIVGLGDTALEDQEGEKINEVMIQGFSPGPASSGGGPWFDSITPYSKHWAIDLYTIQSDTMLPIILPSPVFPSLYIGIGAALGAGVLAYVLRRRFVGSS